MSLPARELDDRRFQDIVDEAKQRITASCPEWTNHNVSDPGVALIELFAWMTELTLFRINQLPDRLQVKFLELMGVRLFGPAAATTELTFWMTGAVAEAVVPAGTEVASSNHPLGDAVVFATEHDLHLHQPQLTACLSGSGDGGYYDLWDDLLYQRSAVTCFPSRPLRSGDSFYLGFDHSLADLVVGLDINADDIQGVGVQPEHPPLAWESWSGKDWIPVRVHADRTGGLNKDGEVLLGVPSPHAPLTLAQHAAHWLRVHLLEPEEGQTTYKTSPRVYSVRPSCRGGTVTAHHSHQAPAEALGRSDGRPGQRFVLTHTPLLAREADETIRVIDPNGPTTTWTEVADFGRSGPDDRHFTCDAATGEIWFGPRIRYDDGVRQHGAIPPAGSEIVHTGYRYGGGELGNAPAGSLVMLRRTIPYIERVENLTPARGGYDAETIANAKLRGPVSLRSGERAVTAADYEHFARHEVPRVARTRCLAPALPGGPVRILVVPRVDRPVDALALDDLSLDDALIAAIGEKLDARRMIGATIEVSTPYYQGVTAAALVKAAAGHSPDAVRQRVLAYLYRLINPISGGSDGTGWPFDHDLNASDVATGIGSIDGVERVGEVVLFAADLRNEEREAVGRDVVQLDDASLFMSFRHRVVVR